MNLYLNYLIHLFSLSACLQGKLLAANKECHGVEKIAEAARSILARKMQDEARDRKC
jgi:hypothetical protein